MNEIEVVKAEVMPIPTEARTIKKCQKCGSDFSAPRWEMKHRKFCSKKCYWESEIIPGSRRCRPHTRVVERLIGKRLPANAVIHHFDEDRKNNNPSNLVVCENQDYHRLLHARKRVLNSGGNPKTEKVCSRCGLVKAKTEFHKSKRMDGYRIYCKDCQSKIYREGRSNART